MSTVYYNKRMISNLSTKVYTESITQKKWSYNLSYSIDKNIDTYFNKLAASLMAQMIRNLPVMQETCVWSLGGEEPLEKEMETHSSFLAWRILWIEKPGGLKSMGLQRAGHDWVTNT